jgi:hypothetical protein
MRNITDMRLEGVAVRRVGKGRFKAFQRQLALAVGISNWLPGILTHSFILNSEALSSKCFVVQWLGCMREAQRSMLC